MWKKYLIPKMKSKHSEYAQVRPKYWEVNNTCHSCSTFQPMISKPLKSKSLSLSFCWNWNPERLSDLFIYLFAIYLFCPSKLVMELGIGDKISDSLFSFRPLTLLKCSQWRLVTFTFIRQASSFLNWRAYPMLRKSQRSQELLLWTAEFRAKLLWTTRTLKNCRVNGDIYLASAQYDVTNSANIYRILCNRHCARCTELIKLIKPRNSLPRRYYCYSNFQRKLRNRKEKHPNHKLGEYDAGFWLWSLWSLLLSNTVFSFCIPVGHQRWIAGNMFCKSTQNELLTQMWTGPSSCLTTFFLSKC